MFNASFSVNNYQSLINASNSINNYQSFVNANYYSFGPVITILSDITKETNKYICTVDDVEVPIEQFYIYRRKGFLTTIIVQLADDLWEEMKDKTGSELIIKWKSASFEGDMANSLIQNISYRNDSKRRIVKLHAFRSKKEVAQREFTIEGVEDLTYENNILKSIKTIPQPAISPEDTIVYKNVDYIVKSVKITADTIKTNMIIKVY